MNNLRGKTVLITGASAGIGKATAYAFAEHGAKLLLNARRKERIEDMIKDIKNKFQTDCFPLIFDVKQYVKVKSAINSLPQEWKNIDILVNNAGLARGVDKIQDSKVEYWEEMIDTNIKGLLYVTKEVIQLMIANNKGHIINLGSIAGREVYIGGNIYCATKFAVKALTRAIRAETLEYNIRVSSIDPGMVKTEFSMVRFNGDEKKADDVYKGLIPLTAEDIADNIIYVASRPEHVNISELIVTPTAQANAFYVNRSNV